jgi:hypothetical protein
LRLSGKGCECVHVEGRMQPKTIQDASRFCTGGVRFQQDAMV